MKGNNERRSTRTNAAVHVHQRFVGNEYIVASYQTSNQVYDSFHRPRESLYPEKNCDLISPRNCPDKRFLKCTIFGTALHRRLYKKRWIAEPGRRRRIIFNAEVSLRVLCRNLSVVPKTAIKPSAAEADLSLAHPIFRTPRIALATLHSIYQSKNLLIIFSS